MNVVISSMKNIKNNINILGEGLRITSDPEPKIYWLGYVIKVKNISHNILTLELTYKDIVTEKKIPISSDEYAYLSKCLSKFNIK